MFDDVADGGLWKVQLAGDVGYRNAVLMQRLEALDAPEQDNAALCVIKPFDPRAADPAPAQPAAPPQPAAPRPRAGRRVITLLASATWSAAPAASRNKTDAPV